MSNCIKCNSALSEKDIADGFTVCKSCFDKLHPISMAWFTTSAMSTAMKVEFPVYMCKSCMDKWSVGHQGAEVKPIKSGDECDFCYIEMLDNKRKERLAKKTA